MLSRTHSKQFFVISSSEDTPADKNLAKLIISELSQSIYFLIRKNLPPDSENFFKTWFQRNNRKALDQSLK